MLNHISLGRIFTPAGFAAQKKMIPLIFKDYYMRRKLINLVFSKIITKKTTSKLKKYLGLDRKTRKARIAIIKKTIGLTSSLG
jgi:hypothetical protein